MGFHQTQSKYLFDFLHCLPFLSCT